MTDWEREATSGSFGVNGERDARRRKVVAGSRETARGRRQPLGSLLKFSVFCDGYKIREARCVCMGAGENSAPGEFQFQRFAIAIHVFLLRLCIYNSWCFVSPVRVRACEVSTCIS